MCFAPTPMQAWAHTIHPETIISNAACSHTRQKSSWIFLISVAWWNVHESQACSHSVLYRRIVTTANSAIQHHRPHRSNKPVAESRQPVPVCLSLSHYQRPSILQISRKGKSGALFLSWGQQDSCVILPCHAELFMHLLLCSFRPLFLHIHTS